MQKLREELKVHIAEKGVSQAAVSRALGEGFSGSVLSQWLKGEYPGDNEKVAKAVRAYLDRQQEKVVAPRRSLEFQMTTVSKKVFEVARLCHLDGEIGVCYGDAGLGKTMASKQYASQNTDVILIEADLGYTAKVLFSELHRRLGMDGRGHLNSLLNDCVDRLKGSGRLIIVDEAEHLPYRALELLRRIYDKAGIGILLVGMPRLISNLRGKKGDYAQLFSRVGYAMRLDPLKEQDVQGLVHSALPNSNGLYKTYHEVSCGNTRVLSKLIMRSIRVAGLNERPVDAEVIQQTAKMLLII